jgi:hypothetical protein
MWAFATAEVLSYCYNLCFVPLRHEVLCFCVLSCQIWGSEFLLWALFCPNDSWASVFLSWTVFSKLSEMGHCSDVPMFLGHVCVGTLCSCLDLFTILSEFGCVFPLGLCSITCKLLISGYLFSHVFSILLWLLLFSFRTLSEPLFCIFMFHHCPSLSELVFCISCSNQCPVQSELVFYATIVTSILC